MENEFKDIIDKAKSRVWKEELKKSTVGTYENPYVIYVSTDGYNAIKHLLDENDMYFVSIAQDYISHCGWYKYIKVQIK